jgi:hypothetical protein
MTNIGELGTTLAIIAIEAHRKEAW